MNLRSDNISQSHLGRRLGLETEAAPKAGSFTRPSMHRTWRIRLVAIARILSIPNTGALILRRRHGTAGVDTNPDALAMSSCQLKQPKP